jgi:hypothetical protein
LGVSPLANNFLKPDQLEKMEPFYPLHVRVCEKCLLVQLPVVVRPEEIFTDYPYFSSYSDTWLEHARTYVDVVIKRFALNEHSQVIEIARSLEES